MPRDEIPDARAALVGEWKGLDRSCARGERRGRPRWLPGCPVRVSCGGVAGNRMLLLTPEPASRALCLEVSSNLRNVNLASLAEVDRIGDPAESLSQRAKQKSAGGLMAAYSPKISAQFRANPVWPPRSARLRKVGPLADGLIPQEELAQIL